MCQKIARECHKMVSEGKQMAPKMVRQGKLMSQRIVRVGDPRLSRRLSRQARRQRENTQSRGVVCIHLSNALFDRHNSGACSKTDQKISSGDAALNCLAPYRARCTLWGLSARFGGFCSLLGEVLYL